ncbi:RDD family protein [Flavobacterium rhizosphaerae]|uniref:RDD family protein n=1 Tax=Flavobacterium rhizosphaerae TaxID=3163298 RepID=A0ABW8YZM5_9FLAO
MEKIIVITPDVLAPANRRLLNYVIDRFVCAALTIGLAGAGNYIYKAYGYDGLAMGTDFLNFELSDYNNLKFNVFALVIQIIYYGLFESLTARTPGKYITGTKVIYQDGTHPAEGSIFIRTLCRQIPFEAFSFLGILPVGWHDRFSKTLVVDVNAFEKKQRENAVEQDINSNND